MEKSLPGAPLDLNAALRNMDLSRGPTPGAKPKPDHLIAHLKLLEAFQQLKEDVVHKDGLFGIQDSFASDGSPAILAKIREKRWAIYVARAVDRFTVWWDTCVRRDVNARVLNQDDLLTDAFSDAPTRGKPMRFTKDTLPPLGKFLSLNIGLFLNRRRIFRCYPGLACLHAQSTLLPRGLYSQRTDGFLGNRDALGCRDRRYR